MIADFLKKLVKVFWLLPGLLLWASFPPVAETTPTTGIPGAPRKAAQVSLVHLLSSNENVLVPFVPRSIP